MLLVTEQMLQEYGAEVGFQGPLTSAHLRRAHLYMTAIYGPRFRGVPVGEDLFPRSGIPDVPEDVVPETVQYALMELAIAEAQSPGILSRATSPDKQYVTQEKVDVVSMSYSTPQSTGKGVDFPLVEGLLAPWLRSTGVGTAMFVV